MNNINFLFCISLIISAIVVKGILSLKMCFVSRKQSTTQLDNMGRYKIKASKYWVGEAIGWFLFAFFLIIIVSILM